MGQERMEIPDNWTFENTSVARHFDQHVRSQLPWYDMVSDALAFFAAHYLPESGGLVYDIGASTGNMARLLRPVLEARHVRYTGIEKSRELVNQSKVNADLPPTAYALMVCEDALDFHYQPFDVAILNLVLMFLPLDRRRGFVQRLRERVKPGGAILVVDREDIVSEEALMVERLRWHHKVDAGETGADIVAKEMSLAGIQRPIDPEILAPAYCWFRMGAFAGWILRRPETQDTGYNWQEVVSVYDHQTNED